MNDESPITGHTWLSRIFHSDFVQGVAITFANRGLLIALGMISSVIVARGLGPEARGDWAYISTLIGLVGQFSLLGLQSANVLYASQEPDTVPALLGNSLATSLALGSVSFLGIAAYDGLLKGSGLSWYVLLCIYATVCVQTCSYLFQNLLLGMHKIRSYNLTEFISQLVGVGATVLLFVTHRLSVDWLLSIGVAAAALCVVTAAAAILRTNKTLPRTDWGTFQKCLRYGWRVYLACVAAFFLARGELFLLEGQISAHDMGQYAVAYGVFSMATVLPSIIGTLLFPKLSVMDGEARWEGLLRTVWLSLPLLLAVTMLLWLAAPIVVNLLYGKAYKESVIPFRILVLSLPAAGMCSLFSNYLATWLFPAGLLAAYALLACGKAVVLAQPWTHALPTLALLNLSVTCIQLICIMVAALVRSRAERAAAIH
ncbi:MAG: oligosaccharide flippase family protein [Desulfomonile tiedjei]|uniref:Oligosaccharide flippase family protein n=1 Tax=Desulfomonile tiedjei TaxID=2358 RepID=A0A9D6Z1X3_9BACT|nr:oligosaccharide flippase family protein [Desulfomonile tiedjei]